MTSKPAKTKKAPPPGDDGAASLLPARSRAATRPIWPVAPATKARDLKRLSKVQRAWLDATGWSAQAGRVAAYPAPDGSVAGAVLGLGDEPSERSPLLAGAMPGALPEGNYHFAGALDDPALAATAWAMGAYEFTRYKASGPRALRRLKLPEGVDERSVRAVARAVAFGRDLINTPANDMGPEELERAARELARAHRAQVKVVKGEALLRQNFPMIHAVGRASDRAPRLIDISCGKKTAPKLTLIGKGICFDTGGLDLKPPSAMALMKKDMGGAASVLALASMIMDAKLPVRLRVLVPAAENSVSANAFRPGDVLTARNGTTVDIGNTDAEGRLVLADAMALADEEAPDTIVTMATLTGAARVALGPDLPPLYTDNDALAAALSQCGHRVGDPLWRMPFWPPYDALLKGKVGDVNHISDGPFAGSITAALFLKRFVEKAGDYVHLDIYGWVPKAKPGKPHGGEPQGARALFEYFRETYS